MGYMGCSCKSMVGVSLWGNGRSGQPEKALVIEGHNRIIMGKAG
jgi:hypothetical protein